MLERGRAGEPLCRQAAAVLGEQGVVELVGVVGYYYSLVSFTLNAFELGLPEDAVAELNDPEFPGA